jgi:hypothetical protein
MTDTSQKFSALETLEGARIAIKEINTMLNELENKKQWWAFELGRFQKNRWHWIQ